MTTMPDLDLTPQKSVSEKASDVIGVILLIVGSVMVRGWLISWGWNHFVITVLRAEPISIPIAFGFSIILKTCLTNYSDLYHDIQDKTPMRKRITSMFVFYLSSWLIMWIVWQFV